MKISDRRLRISDSLKISDFSNSLGVLQHPKHPQQYAYVSSWRVVPCPRHVMCMGANFHTHWTLLFSKRQQSLAVPQDLVLTLGSQSPNAECLFARCANVRQRGSPCHPPCCRNGDKYVLGPVAPSRFSSELDQVGRRELVHDDCALHHF